jgi:hypothetical protein
MTAKAVQRSSGADIKKLSSLCFRTKPVIVSPTKVNPDLLNIKMRPQLCSVTYYNSSEVKSQTVCLIFSGFMVDYRKNNGVVQ